MEKVVVSSEILNIHNMILQIVELEPKVHQLKENCKILTSCLDSAQFRLRYANLRVSLNDES